VQVIETITVFDQTGTEVTGLVNADFTKVLHKNGAVSAVAVTVAEIGAGEYKVTFTPDAVGQWRLRIEQSTGNAYNKKGWQETYDASTEGSLSAAEVWDYVLETGFSAKRLLRIVAALVAGKSTGGLVNVTVRDLADTENMMTGSADAAGNRTPTSFGG
jgi:hypothetical protein